MTTPTPEELRTAADVLRRLAISNGWSQEASRTPRDLSMLADRIEQEQDAKAKRGKRINELAESVWIGRELWNRGDGKHGTFDPLCPSTQWALYVAHYLLNRFPALAEEGESLRYNENTLTKVGSALRSCGLGFQEATDAIAAMQNAGILFRERA
ncbi:hypothetical protein PBI_GAIA_55 [Mycobacterium phage Gaia]|uniref:Uncharacterized protein n=1 Tax=Mycobacterium phage Gaia TaxID=1486472 RepID=A0A068F2F2_9CAUD|nr:hypothetical protein VC46_gp178 [Mycobacterium phage Gaia]AID58874.1 hypothetical protein PBI_GAIA_55 [Mycobacterium phage Gaia]